MSTNRRWVRQVLFTPAVKPAGYRFKKMSCCVLCLNPCYYCVNDSIQLNSNVLTLLCGGRLGWCSNNHCSSLGNRCAQSTTMLCSDKRHERNCFLTVCVTGQTLQSSSHCLLQAHFGLIVKPVGALPLILWEQAELSSECFSKVALCDTTGRFDGLGSPRRDIQGLNSLTP